MDSYFTIMIFTIPYSAKSLMEAEMLKSVIDIFVQRVGTCIF